MARLTTVVRGLTTRGRIALLAGLLLLTAAGAQVFRTLIEQDAIISIVAFRIDALEDLGTAAIPASPSIVESDLRGVDVGLIADPFFLKQGDTTHLFFEVVNEATGSGEIAHASGSLEDGFSYQGVVLREPFHLSYPHVFEADGAIWMVPESWEAGAVRLYRADPFPSRWTYVGDLVKGGEFVDPTPFRHDGRWWMFVSDRTNGRLDLYFSDTLTTGWTAHPQNPLITGNPDIARPGGRIIEDHGQLYRVGQDAYPSYGLAVGLFAIEELTPTRYRESAHPRNPVLGPSGRGWNADGMHHLDLQWMGDHWLGVADGHDAWRYLRGTPLVLGRTFRDPRQPD